MALVYHKLDITTAGRLALIPDAARSGDIVAIMFGCDVPLVLRPNADGTMHRIVGECYVDGVMDGEAVDQHEPEDIRELYLE